jgi:type VI secretion system protein ImpJ
MSWHNKVIWSEGMFLRPQHFQQQDRWADQLLRQSVTSRHPFPWGVRTLEIDRNLLETGKLSMTRCQGILPDGAPFSVPEEQDAPPIIDVGTNVRDKVVYLAAPIERSMLVAAEFGGTGGGLPRYERREIEVYDEAEVSLGSKAMVEVGRLKLSLKIHGESLDGYHLIPITRIVEVRSEDRKVVLDESFIPSCIDHRVSSHLAGFVRELEGLLRQRGEALAGRVATSGRGGVAEIADFLLLQLVNRLEPQVTHINGHTGLHPEDLYRMFLGIAGELATFTQDSKRPEPYPVYKHGMLVESFRPVEDAIRRALTMVMEQTAVAIPLEELKFNIFRAIIHDRTLLETATFLLEVSADMDPERLMKAFRDQSKVGPIEKIRELVNLALSGIPLRARPTAPRQIPFHAGAIYFELDKSHELWQPLQQSGALALHVTSGFPNLAMTLWAIKR